MSRTPDSSAFPIRLGAAIGTVLLSSFALPVCDQASAATHRVPSDFPTIQAAINAAVPNDEILIAPGTYHENLDTGAKYLLLRSEAGAEFTIVDGGYRERVLSLRSGGIVDGLTIRRGRAHYGAGIFLGKGAPFVIRNNIIEENVAGLEFDSGDGGGLGGGGYKGGGAIQIIELNLIRNNRAGSAAEGSLAATIPS